MKTKVFAALAVSLMVMTAFAVCITGTDSSDATTGTFVSPGDSYYAINTVATAFNSYTTSCNVLDAFGGFYVHSGAPIDITISDFDGAECSKVALNKSVFGTSVSAWGLTGTITDTGFTLRGTITNTVTVNLRYFDYYDESNCTLQFTIGVVDSPLSGTFSCQGIGGGDTIPSQLFYSVGDTINLTVDCECGDGITYSWSPSAPAGISVVNASAAYPFHIRGTWQNEGTYTLHTDCNENGCENNVTFNVSQGSVPQATVVFNPNGGSSAQPTVTVDQGSVIILPSASKQYYSFSGWYTAQSGGTRVGGAGDSYTVNGDVTLYAQYNVIPVSFTTTQDTEYIVQGSSFSYTAGTSPADAVLSVSGASWLSVSGKNVAGTASPSVNPGTYHITLTTSYGTQSAVQTFDIVVVEKLIFESVPTGGIIALPA